MAGNLQSCSVNVYSPLIRMSKYLRRATKQKERGKKSESRGVIVSFLRVQQKNGQNGSLSKFGSPAELWKVVQYYLRVENPFITAVYINI